MKLIGKNGPITIGTLVGEDPIGKVVSISEPSEQCPSGSLIVRWSGDEPLKKVLPSEIGVKFQD
jgi:hypothetical protein